MVGRGQPYYSNDPTIDSYKITLSLALVPLMIGI